MIGFPRQVKAEELLPQSNSIFGFVSRRLECREHLLAFGGAIQFFFLDRIAAFRDGFCRRNEEKIIHSASLCFHAELKVGNGERRHPVRGSSDLCVFDD